VSSQDLTRILEVGIDYITATSHSTSSLSGLGAFGAYLVRDAVKRGSKRTASRALGYTGAHAEGVSVGTRHDGCIVRLSGETAREHWNQALDLSDNVTRLDLQVTEVPPEGPARRLAGVWRHRGAGGKGLGRHSKMKAVVSQKAVETIMIGSRQSDRYMRIYDKFEESRLNRYKGAVRWELELKKEIAREMAIQLSLSEAHEDQVIAQVSKFVRDRVTHLLLDMRWPGIVPDEIKIGRQDALAVSAERSCRFLAVSVKPLCQRLVQAGHRDLVLRSLGFDDLVGPRDYDRTEP
jgi:hypothetical protein